MTEQVFCGFYRAVDILKFLSIRNSGIYSLFVSILQNKIVLQLSTCHPSPQVLCGAEPDSRKEMYCCCKSLLYQINNVHKIRQQGHLKNEHKNKLRYMIWKTK